MSLTTNLCCVTPQKSEDLRQTYVSPYTDVVKETKFFLLGKDLKVFIYVYLICSVCIRLTL